MSARSASTWRSVLPGTDVRERLLAFGLAPAGVIRRLGRRREVHRLSNNGRLPATPDYGLLGRMSRLPWLILLSLACACPPGQTETTGSSASGSTGDGSTATTGGMTTDPTTGLTTGGTTGLACDFFATPDECPGDQECVPIAGDIYDAECVTQPCALWKQDCPEGQKCIPYGPGLVQTRCVPLAPLPVGPLKPCVASGAGDEIVDDCDESSICWFIDGGDYQGDGLCLPLCHPDHLQCADGSLCISITVLSELYQCLPLCDPRVPSCPGSSSCQYDLGEQFSCNWSFDQRTYGEPCGAIAQCVDGLTCGAAIDIPGCASDFCCTSFCDVSAPNTCPDAPTQECLSYFENLGGRSPPGFEDIGVCAIP